MSLRREPQQQRSQERLEQILAAAAEVFLEMGYEAATTQTIATRANTAVGTLYRFFPDKLAIFHALEKRHLDNLSVIQARIMTPQFMQQPLKQVVQQIVRTYADYFLDPAPCVVYIQYFVRPEIFAYFDESFDQWQIQKMSELFCLRNPQLPIEKSQLLSEVFLRTYQVLLLSALRSEPSHRQLLYREIEALLIGYLEPHAGDDLTVSSAAVQAQEQAQQLKQKHQLTERQTLAIAYVLEHGAMTIQDFEMVCPKPSRRSLQRDIKILLDKHLLVCEGATNQLTYHFNNNL